MKKVTNQPMKILFMIYMLFLFLFVIIKIDNGLRGINLFNIFDPNISLRVNLVPFETIQANFSAIQYGFYGNAFFNLVGNTIAFLPLGFFLGYLYKYSFIKTALLSFLISSSFEVFQLLTNLGRFDIDDIILNVGSIIIGYLMYRIFKIIKESISRLN
ncbi:glycopeptide antibiotics resistance protein [Breznakia sp. PF5-3]|uniref:VanZ family protein n=1 Tax=unclassified Breznakia TaxID=2623764 RepID=UPI0024066376|nr:MULTISPECIES: VanZ family protein [unclassified Breznakia]MDF9824279.1 glycopeptide antibiotics resistance protein [Breznakia sp. PM6-1]MDF9835503.1 glycopeptide antibiotics resistance protein [Breznakia sp. PF5-3]MDF9838023.1 glycopeptide antibiotics resistance protein [Breznakia sp. PFB2-8]MDF9859401.1 glycopeptide antibiotics resistance protein [Breznakia sp. PH5-24]